MVEVKFKEGIARLDQEKGKWYFFKVVTLRNGNTKLIPRPVPYRVKRVLNIDE